MFRPGSLPEHECNEKEQGNNGDDVIIRCNVSEYSSRRAGGIRKPPRGGLDVGKSPYTLYLLFKIQLPLTILKGILFMDIFSDAFFIQTHYAYTISTGP